MLSAVKPRLYSRVTLALSAVFISDRPIYSSCSEFCLCLFVEYHSMLIECLMGLKKNLAKVPASILNSIH